MRNLAKGLYGINSVTCIFIGVLHTLAHYSDLSTKEIEKIINHDIMVTGLPSNIWELWQGMSLMMGFLLIIIGLLHLFIISQLKNTYPHVGSSVIMILMLLGIIYAGVNFFNIWQVYGGIIGILLQMTCLFLSIRSRRIKYARS